MKKTRIAINGFGRIGRLILEKFLMTLNLKSLLLMI